MFDSVILFINKVMLVHYFCRNFQFNKNVFHKKYSISETSVKTCFFFPVGKLHNANIIPQDQACVGVHGLRAYSGIPMY